MINPPLSLYIHIPWCIKKCPYCDFNSHTMKNSIPEEAYADALIRDIELDLPKIEGRKINSIFIGGGTPSLFSATTYEKLLTTIKTRISCKPEMEITLEANPGTFEQAKFIGFRQAGINRLSIGCQSFNDRHLKKLGRIHGSKEALKAIETAKIAGFDNINLDLMFGLPQQTLNEALTDLQQAVIFNPAHISWYQLTLEPNTLFYQQPPSLPHEDEIAEIYETGFSYLSENQFYSYEVSAYAKLDRQCIHNRNYWEFGDYLGIGAGAHSKISDLQQGVIRRFLKHKHPKTYLTQSVSANVGKPSDNNFIVQEEIIPQNQIAFEFMLNALRLQEHISKTLFESRTGLSFTYIQAPLELAQRKELLIVENGCFYPTDLGRRFLNDLVGLFLEM